jgi:hypothetical protein
MSAGAAAPGLESATGRNPAVPRFTCRTVTSALENFDAWLVLLASSSWRVSEPITFSSGPFSRCPSAASRSSFWLTSSSSSRGVA